MFRPQKMQEGEFQRLTKDSFQRDKTKGITMAKNEKTSKRVGKIASQQLRSKSTSKKAKSTAASALTQRPDRKKRKK